MNEPIFEAKSRSWVQKFGDAGRGVVVGMRGQSSFRVHLACAVLVLLAAGAMQVERNGWCLLLLCIALVLAAELFNSALERMAKAVDQRVNPHLADALDISSGAVMVVAIGAASVGAVVFLARLVELLAGHG